MINLNFYNAVAIYLSCIVLIFLGSWLFMDALSYKETKTQVEFLRQCPICTHLFFDFRSDKVSLCPRCKSYLKKEEVK